MPDKRRRSVRPRKCAEKKSVYAKKLRKTVQRCVKWSYGGH